VKYSRIIAGVSSIALTACGHPPTPVAPSASLPIAIAPAISPQPTPSASQQAKLVVSPTPAPPSIKPSIKPSVVPSVAPLPTLDESPKPLQPGDYQVINELKQPQFVAQSQAVFRSAQLPTARVDFNPADLLVVLNSTRKYFQERAAGDPDLQREGILGLQGVKVAEIVKTLDFMVLTLTEDIKAKRSIRLQDPNFINTNFRAIQWTAFNPASKQEKRLRLTKYAVFTHPGSRTPTPQFNAGIYALKSGNDAEQLRAKYTKQDVLTNIYEPKGKEFGNVEPLAYLDRDGLESALMEGTILVKFPDGSSDFFNVDRNNGIPFIKGLTPTEQKRYWYFQRVDEIRGYGSSIDTKISVKPGVTFAGDVLNIGLGRIVVLEHSTGDRQHLRMGIIADTGGAFLPNLHQLDFLAGVFNSKDEFAARTRNLPEYAKAYILVKR
jgi:hypothetical protein